MSDASPSIQELQQQLQQMERALAQAQKMSSVGALASSITHEFNNILTTVINYAKLGLRHSDEAARTKAFTRILAAGQRASKITTGMLSYARGTEDRQQATDLKHLVSNVLVLVEKDLQMHRVGLDVDLPDGIWATVNPMQIQQILVNLIVNARQATPEGGRITVRINSAAADGWSEIHVRDTGCGISQENLQKIFEAFYTTKTADKQGQGGTGLGLSLCRRIIEAHKGRIRVESEVGKGTQFTLKLPHCEAPRTMVDSSAA